MTIVSVFNNDVIFYENSMEMFHMV